LLYKSGIRVTLAGKQLDGEVAYSDERLTREVGEILWSMVKEARWLPLNRLASNVASGGAVPDRGVNESGAWIDRPDFRFTNIGRLEQGRIATECRVQTGLSLQYLMYQIVARTRMSAVPPSLVATIRPLLAQNRAEMLFYLLQGFDQIPPELEEPLFIFLPN
jgi:hypothetical protein